MNSFPAFCFFSLKKIEKGKAVAIALSDALRKVRKFLEVGQVIAARRISLDALPSRDHKRSA
jgi:hypothetical protein